MNELYKITTTQSGKTNVSKDRGEISIIQTGEGTVEKQPFIGEKIDTAASDSSIENYLNAYRMKRFKSEFSIKLLRLLREQDFEYGVDSPADELVRNALYANESIAKEWLNQLFVDRYDDQTVLIGILRVLSHFDYHVVNPQGPTMALAALSNASAEVRECGIRAFENWGTLNALEILKNIKCQEKWLNEYLQQVIADLKEELGENGVVG